MEAINEIIEHTARIASAALESYMDPGSPGVKDVVLEVARKLSKQIVTREWVSPLSESYRAGDYVNSKVESSVLSVHDGAFTLLVKYRSVGVKVELSAEQALALLGSRLGTGWGLYAALGPISSMVYRKSLEDITTMSIQEGKVKVTYVEPDRPYPGVYFVFNDGRATARSFEARLEELAARLGEAADTLGARPSPIGDPRGALMIPHWCINSYVSWKLEGLVVETRERVQGLATSACWDYWETKTMALRVHAEPRLLGLVSSDKGGVSIYRPGSEPLLLTREALEGYRIEAVAEMLRDYGFELYSVGAVFIASSPYVVLEMLRHEEEKRAALRLPMPVSVELRGLEIRGGLTLTRARLADAEKGYEESLNILEEVLELLSSPDLL